MRNTFRSRTLAAVAALGILVAACGGDDATDTAPAPAPEAPADEAPAEDAPSFIYITPNPIGINKFLELGEIGTQAAAAELGGTARTFESTDLSSRRANLEAAVDDAPTVIVLTTFEFTELADEFANANPDQAFILIDACPDAPPANLACGVFREYEGAHLLGVMAGELTESGRIGSVVALDIPFLKRFSDGFARGAASVNADVVESQVFIGGDNPFSDPPRAKEQALALAAQGADHIFAVGSGSNGGVFEAAQEEGFLSYGVDVDQCSLAPGYVVDNNLKRVDVVVETLIQQVLAGTAEAFNSFGLAERGMGVVALSDDLAASDCVIKDFPEVIETVRDVHDRIVAGELVLEDPMFG